MINNEQAKVVVKQILNAGLKKAYFSTFEKKFMLYIFFKKLIFNIQTFFPIFFFQNKENVANNNMEKL